MRYVTTRTLLFAAAIGLTAPAVAQEPAAGHGGHGAPAAAAATAGHEGHAMPAAGGTSPASSAYMEAMETMQSAMAAMPMTGKPGTDFAAMMIPHHQSAIDMAEAYLASGDTDPELTKLAREIVTAQKAEIATLEDWLKRNGGK